MQRRISEEVKDKDEAKTALMQTEKKERLAREEISTLLIKINEQEETHHRIVNELKQDIQELVVSSFLNLHGFHNDIWLEEQCLVSLTNQVKNNISEYIFIQIHGNNSFGFWKWAYFVKRDPNSVYVSVFWIIYFFLVVFIRLFYPWQYLPVFIDHYAMLWPIGMLWRYFVNFRMLSKRMSRKW